MKNKKFRKIAILVAVMMLVMSFSSTGFASWLDQTIKASYRNISVYVNGTMKQAKTATGAVVEPFIVDGTTYVPLRGIAEMLGYQVTFNPTTYRIDITGTDVAALQLRLAQQQVEIENLKKQLAAKSTDLSDLEDELNDDYSEFDSTLDIDDIFLDGDEDDIEVEIYLDASDDNDDFDYWYETIDDFEEDIIKFLQKVVDDILDEYEDADITGFIGFDEDDDTFVYFSIDSKGNVKLEDSILGGINNIGDLEDALNAEFGEYKTFDFDISVYKEVVDDIYIDVEIQNIDIDEDLSASDWDNIDNYLDDLGDFVREEYNSDAFIVGDFIGEDGGSAAFDHEDGKLYWVD